MSHGRAQRARRAFSVALGLGLIATLFPATGASAATPLCFGRKATIVGTRGNDTLRGTNGSDVIVARGGEFDVIRARGGRDFVCGGGGTDIVFAGGGNDRVNTGRGFDGTFPGGGDDLVIGGGLFDIVTYEGQMRPIEADLGQGVVRGLGTDRLRSIEGVAGSEGPDVLTGTDGSDDLLGYGGNDTIVAGDGDDFLNSGAGNDTVDGGAGHDFVDMLFSNAGPDLGDDSATDAGVNADLAAGTATGPEGVGNDSLAGIEGIGGTLGDDTLTGNDAFNELGGFEGNDTISAGGPGEPDPLGTTDLMFPGPGNDTVTGSSGVDAVDYSFLSPVGGEPTAGVTVDLQAGTATGSDIGNDTLSGIEQAGGTIFDDNMTGTGQANFLLGFDGSDSLDGAAGDDVLDGDVYVFGLNEELSGTDVLTGGPGTDICLGGSALDSGCESSEWPPPAAMRIDLKTFRTWGAASYLRSQH